MPTANDVYKALKDGNFNTFWPTKAPAPLDAKCCVVSDSDAMTEFATDVLGYDYIDVDVCVPASRYGEMDAFLKSVLSRLKKVPGLRYNGISSTWHDDDMRASIRTVEFKVSKRHR